jgi:conjugative transfer signal peptidase TraF
VSHRRLTIAALAAVGLAAIFPHRARLICNVSPSVPVGIYRFKPGAAKPGDLAVVYLPATLRAFADARRYLPRSLLLLKPVAATSGDVVCRVGPRLWINRRASVPMRTVDGLSRPLPAWRGCRRLSPDEVFLLSPAPDSYDSRYFGPLDILHVIGIAIPLFTFANRREVP